MKLSVVGAEELPEAAAETFARAIRDAIVARGRCSFALSRPPAGVLETLAGAELDWSAVDIFQVDERVAPDGDPERNLTLIERGLSEAAPNVRLHPMSVTDPDLDGAGSRYAAELESMLGSPPVLDVVHLGLGPDGHTASLLPGDPVLEVRDRWVAMTGEAAGYRRMTLTYPVLDAARLIVFVVGGGPKADAVRRVLKGDPTMPAVRVRARHIRVLADEPAAGAQAKM